MEKRQRHGTFSSSNNHKLMEVSRDGKNFGVPAKKYIKQVNYELELGRAISKETNAKSTNWGTFIERRAFNLLGLEYQLVSEERLFHKTIPYWSGAPDLIKPNTVCDVKCPYNMEVFCDKINALNSGVEVYKKEFPEDYWQHISNAILLNENGIKITNFEAIIYVPYKRELEEIREDANNYDGNQNNIAFLNWADDSELPYLIEGRKYKNLNVFNFEVPESDKNLLTEKVILAGTMLTNFHEIKS